MRFAIVLLVILLIMFAGLVVMSIVVGVKDQKEYVASHKALCNYMYLASQATHLEILNPSSATSVQTAAKVKLLQFELVFLRGCNSFSTST